MLSFQHGRPDSHVQVVCVQLGCWKEDGPGLMFVVEQAWRPVVPVSLEPGRTLVRNGDFRHDELEGSQRGGR